MRDRLTGSCRDTQIAEEAHLRGEQPDDPAIARHVPAARREPEHDETVETSAVKRRKLVRPLIESNQAPIRL